MEALGMIETKGLIAAVEGLDSMLKAADVDLINGILVGSGLVNITIEGDVGAVKAAVDAGIAAVQALDPELLVSEHVIPRPDASLDGIAVVRRGADETSEPEDPEPDPSPDDGGTPEPENNGPEEKPEEGGTEEPQPQEAEAPATETAEEVPEEKAEEAGEPEPESADEAEPEEQPAPEPEAEETAGLAEDESPAVEPPAQAARVEEVSNTEAVKVPEEPAEETAGEEEKPSSEDSKPEEPAEHADLPDEVRSNDDIEKLVAEAGVDSLDTALAGLRVSELRKIARSYKGFGLSGRDISKANKKTLITAFKEYYR